MKTFLFVDTNVFIHFPALDQIDWLDLIIAKEAMIIITAINLRELNRLKDSHSHPKKTKDRAAAATKLLKLWLKDKKPIRKGVETMYEPRNAPRGIFDDNSLVFEIDDDHHLAAILMFKQENPNSRIIFATQDVGLELKVETFNIEPLNLPDEIRLPEEIDPLIKENRRLEQELNALKSNIAKPILLFDNGTNRLEINFLPFESTLDLENTIGQLKSVHVPYNRSNSANIYENPLLPRPISYLESISQPTNQEIARYNSDLELFFEQYETWMLDCEKIDEDATRTFEIKLCLTNQGTCPADDVDIFLRSSSVVFVLPDVLPEKPDEPELPEQPKNTVELMSEERSRHFSTAGFLGDFAARFPLVTAPTNVSTPETFSDNGENFVCFHVNKFKHGDRLKLDSVCVTFPKDGLRSLQLDYEIKAANVPQAIKGQLHLILRQKSL